MCVLWPGCCSAPCLRFADCLRERGSLLMARAAARERELGAVCPGRQPRPIDPSGAYRNLMLTLAGAAAGSALAAMLLHVFISIAPAGIPFLVNAHLDCESFSSQCFFLSSAAWSLALSLP